MAERPGQVRAVAFDIAAKLRPSATSRIFGVNLKGTTIYVAYRGCYIGADRLREILEIILLEPDIGKTGPGSENRLYGAPDRAHGIFPLGRDTVPESPAEDDIEIVPVIQPRYPHAVEVVVIINGIIEKSVECHAAI